MEEEKRDRPGYEEDFTIRFKSNCSFPVSNDFARKCKLIRKFRKDFPDGNEIEIDLASLFPLALYLQRKSPMPELDEFLMYTGKNCEVSEFEKRMIERMEKLEKTIVDNSTSTSLYAPPSSYEISKVFKIATSRSILNFILDLHDMGLINKEEYLINEGETPTFNKAPTIKLLMEIVAGLKKYKDKAIKHTSLNYDFVMFKTPLHKTISIFQFGRISVHLSLIFSKDIRLPFIRV